MASVDDRRFQLAIRLYGGAWRLAIPWLKRNARLRDGFSQRRLEDALPAADLWIQAASGGEAYLAIELIRHLNPDRKLRTLVTTNTRQGMEILEKTVSDTANQTVSVSTAYFPFDQPGLMEHAVEQVNPKLMVLLETEIWPGLLYALKRAGRPVYIVNGRMTERSLCRYMKWPSLFYALKPDKVLAISDADAARFGKLFGPNAVSTMSNIKFDRVPTGASASENRIHHVLPSESPFLVLGSVREEEEPVVERMIDRIHAQCPDAVIGLFPRHMHRLDHWKQVLKKTGASWCLRSEAQPPSAGQIILWDTFGELAGAYAAADAVFVGGSLAPLGGQNFLEPLLFGIVPVIGPSHENFSWIGEDVFNNDLVIRTADWQQAADHLIEQLRNPAPRPLIRSQAIEYVRARQGGTLQACLLIHETLGFSTQPKSPESSQ